MELQHDAEYLSGFFDTVLVLTGIVLNFFIVDCMGLCLGSVMKTVMISQGYFIYSFIPGQCLHSIKIFSAPQTDPPSRRLGLCKKLGGKES